MADKIYTFLGLATKAGRVISGDESVERALKSGKMELIIISGDASDNTKKKFTNLCRVRSVDLRFFGEKEKLGKFVGKDIRSVIAIIDRGFAGRLIDLIDNQ